MAYEIKMLDLIDIELESSFLVLARNMGIRTQREDVGLPHPRPRHRADPRRHRASHPEIMETLGMTGTVTKEMTLRRQLVKHGVKINEVRWILHTHHHIDHAGQDSQFSMRQTVVTNRRELEYSVSGIEGGQYPAEYVEHHIDRLHKPGAMRLLDLELSGPDEIAPGIVCEAAGGHTEGSMNILVETAEGTACICGDVVYDIQNQMIDPIYQVLDYEPQSTGNQGTSKRQERAAIKRALEQRDVPAADPRLPGARRARPRRLATRGRLRAGTRSSPSSTRPTGETRKMGLGREEFSLPPAP